MLLSTKNGNSPRVAMQVHADASNFADGVTKEEAYEQVLMQAEGLFTDQRNWVRVPASTFLRSAVLVRLLTCLLLGLVS